MLVRRLALGLVAVVAACSSAPPSATPSTIPRSTSTSSTTTTEAPTTTTTVALPEPVPIEWHACGGPFECATVRVPLDYSDPTAGSLDLALTRRPARDPARRIGSLLMNPGGPGASGVRRVQGGFTITPEVADRFDIIGFDPRGVGASSPLGCGSRVEAFRATDLSPDTDEEHEALEAAARAVADECWATDGDRLPHLGTTAVAHDVEVIRRALDEPAISFVALSYGTFIGQLWADVYPSSVRALVLDAVLDPRAGSGAEASTEQVRGVDAVVEAIDAACEADPSCPVAAAGGVLAAYDELSARVEAGEGAAAGVGPTQLAYAAVRATYDSSYWPRLWTALADGLAGDFDGVASLARSYTSLVDYVPFALVSCLDSPHARDYAAWQLRTRVAQDVSHRFGPLIANELLPCAFWPEATFVPRPLRASGTPPILVIGSTGDAATPLAQAQRVARALADARLLTVELDTHVSLSSSACAREAAARYLIDLELPAPGATCGS